LNTPLKQGVNERDAPQRFLLAKYPLQKLSCARLPPIAKKMSPSVAGGLITIECKTALTE
jgi:hypothetical protein